MLDNLITFPGTREAEVPQRAPLARAARDWTIGRVGHELGYAADLSDRVLVANIRQLIRTEGFPEPKTPRHLLGRRLRGAEAVTMRSIWDADRVQLWLDGDLPPAAAAAKAANDRTATRARLGDRALAIAGRN